MPKLNLADLSTFFRRALDKSVGVKDRFASKILRCDWLVKSTDTDLSTTS